MSLSFLNSVSYTLSGTFRSVCAFSVLNGPSFGKDGEGTVLSNVLPCEGKRGAMRNVTMKYMRGSIGVWALGWAGLRTSARIKSLFNFMACKVTQDKMG